MDFTLNFRHPVISILSSYFSPHRHHHHHHHHQFGQGITKEIECPKHMVGRIIGKGGETVKGLQRQFAASIQIEQNATPCKVRSAGLI